MNGAVITAKDEAGTIGELVYQLKKQGLEVCVVDDGSKDDTGKVAQISGAHVIRHDKSKGIGKSLIEAWEYAISQGWNYTVQIDAGGSHNPIDCEDWEVYHFPFTENKPLLMIGSRFLPQSKYIGRKWRAVASQIVAGMLNWATHKKISDWTSGYRVFSRKALQTLVKLIYLSNMHTWQIEVLDEALHRGFTVKEFPITYKAGDSTMKWKTVDDLIKVYLWILNK